MPTRWNTYVTGVYNAPAQVDAPPRGVLLYATQGADFLGADAAIRAAIRLHVLRTRYHRAPNAATVNRMAAQDAEMVRALHDAGMTIIYRDYILLHKVPEVQLFYLDHPVQLGFAI
jgi:hypothetical protein